MKKIIDGFRYDTEKAITVGSYKHGHYPQSGDFSHWSATLFITKTAKRFFLYGQGGGMTIFAQHCSYDSRCGGEKLIPMSRKDALAWAEQYLDAEEIEEHFREDIQDA